VSVFVFVSAYLCLSVCSCNSPALANLASPSYIFYTLYAILQSTAPTLTFDLPCTNTDSYKPGKLPVTNFYQALMKKAKPGNVKSMFGGMLASGIDTEHQHDLALGMGGSSAGGEDSDGNETADTGTVCTTGEGEGESGGVDGATVSGTFVVLDVDMSTGAGTGAEAKGGGDSAYFDAKHADGAGAGSKPLLDFSNGGNGGDDGTITTDNGYNSNDSDCDSDSDDEEETERRRTAKIARGLQRAQAKQRWVHLHRRFRLMCAVCMCISLFLYLYLCLYLS